jgi:hypothetical protein
MALGLLTMALAGCPPALYGAWSEIGPKTLLDPGLSGNQSLSGQVSAIAVDLDSDPTGNTVYVGTSSGGLWKSTNGLGGSATFTPLSDQTKSLSVGAVAVDTKKGSHNIYVGTGAPDNASNVSAYTGTGILISRDSGQSWPEHVSGTADGQHSFVGLGFSSILVDPNNPSVILASTGAASDFNFAPSTGVQSYAPLKDIGIYRSTDAGKTWTQVWSVPSFTVGCGCSADSFSAHVELVYDSLSGHYFAGISGLGVLQSTTQGASWVTSPIPGLGASQFIRVSLAARDGSVWALVMTKAYPAKPANPTQDDNAFQLWNLHRLRADNPAMGWSTVGLQSRGLPTSDVLFKGFLDYVAAPPKSTKLIAAWQDPYVIDLAGRAPWQDISPNESDQHVLAFADATHWYLGNDHGIFVTSDAGTHWLSQNNGIRAQEFFSAAPDSSGSGRYAGTIQDNGDAVSVDANRWSKVNPPDAGCGEGGYSFADPQDATAFFVSGNGGCIYYVKSGNPPTTFSSFSNVVASDNPTFTTPFEILPNDSRLYSGVTGTSFDFAHARIFLAGGQNPWILAFNPSDKTSFSKQLGSSLNQPIAYIKTVPGDPTSAYLSSGSSSALPTALYRLDNISFNGGAKLTAITGGPLDGSNLGPMAISPVDSNTVYLVKAGFQDGQKVFKRTVAFPRGKLGGQTWTNISGNLANVPVDAIVVDGKNPSAIYVGTNTGAYGATDGGVSGEQWRPIGNGLPNVPVMQLTISANRKLVAATWGRGVWSLALP